MKILLMIIVFIGGIYGLLQFKEDNSGNYSPYLLLYLFGWFVAIIGSFFWAMWGRSASAVERDVNTATKLLGVCRYCGKKLPSVLTAKCPHCTANL